MTPSTHTKRRRLWWIATAVSVLLVGTGVAIGLLIRDRDQPPAGQPGLALNDLAASQAALPACADLFQVGKPVGDPEGGCRDADGTIQFVGANRCSDGRRLVNVDRVTGVQTGWGFVGDAYHSVPGEVAGDPGFGAAYRACTG